MDLVRTAGIDRQVGVIARLLVDPGIRRQGIGAKLLDKARSHIVSLGLAPVLDVVSRFSPTEVSLYRSTGWTEIGEVTFEDARTDDQRAGLSRTKLTAPRSGDGGHSAALDDPRSQPDRPHPSDTGMVAVGADTIAAGSRGI